MKGHITGLSRDANCPDSYELSFPVLSGMSGAPLIRHFPVEGQSKMKTGIVGFAYGSRESEIVKHTKNVSQDFEEVVARIQELGPCIQSRGLCTHSRWHRRYGRILFRMNDPLTAA